MRKEKPERSAFYKLNRAILIAHIICPVWLFAAISTYGFTGELLLAVLITSLITAGIYKLVKKYNKGKPLLIAARVAAILALIAFYLPLIGLLGFNSKKEFYPVKRYVYTKGVFSRDSAVYECLLPEELPERCDGYHFRTKGGMIAQDHHPSSYLTFRTDADSMADLDAFYGTISDIRLDRSSSDEDSGFAQKLEWLCGQMNIAPYPSESAVIHWFGGRYPQAVLLDPETGLVAILT